MDTKQVYSKLLDASGGDYGEAFNRTEIARKGRPSDPSLEGLTPEQLVEVNRMAQAADVPATAILAAPYEAMKAIEQKTGIPVLSGPSRLANAIGIPVAMPGKNTSPASLGNVKASLSGALMRGLGLRG